MIQRLGDRDRYIRIRAIEILDKQGQLSEYIIDRLAQLLKHDYYIIRHLVVKVIGKQGKLSEQIINTLIQLLGDEDEDNDVRHRIVVVLGKQGQLSEHIVDRLAQLLAEGIYSDIQNRVAGILSRQHRLSKISLQHLLMCFHPGMPYPQITSILCSHNEELCNLLVHTDKHIMKQVLELWLYESLDGFPTYVVTETDPSGCQRLKVNGRTFALDQEHLEDLQLACCSLRAKHDLPAFPTDWAVERLKSAPSRLSHLPYVDGSLGFLASCRERSTH